MTPGPRPQGISPHAPLDPMQPAGEPFFKHVAPDAARAAGPVAAPEAHLDRRDALRVPELSGAGRAWKPARETSRAWRSPQIWRCLAMTANLTSPHARTTATPRSVTGRTAPILNSRLNFRLARSTLQFLDHDLIFVSTKPAADQRFVLSGIVHADGSDAGRIGAIFCPTMEPGPGGWWIVAAQFVPEA
jgi:hypothetical protein